MKLRTLCQSIWLDYIQCDLIVSGELWRLFVYDGLRGMTSNPSIFDKAIACSHDYEEDIRAMVSDGKGVKAFMKLSASEMFRAPLNTSANPLTS